MEIRHKRFLGKLWKVAMNRVPTESVHLFGRTVYVVAPDYELAGAAALSWAVNDDNRDCGIEAVEPLVVSTHNVEIKHYDTVPM